MFSTAQDLEDQLVALVAVLAGQGLQPLERRRLQRLEAVPLEHLANLLEDPVTGAQRTGEKVAGARRRYELLSRHENSPDLRQRARRRGKSWEPTRIRTCSEPGDPRTPVVSTARSTPSRTAGLAASSEHGSDRSRDGRHGYVGFGFGQGV